MNRRSRRRRFDPAAGAVKPAVAQHDALHRRRFEDLPLERGDALHGHALQPVSTQVQWMVFAIWLGAWSIDPGDALRDQATRASLTSRRDQIAGALVANACVAEERSGPLRRITNVRKVGQLVNDDLRLCLEDGPCQRFGVEDVHNDRFGAHLPETRRLVPRTRRSPNRMTSGAEERQEPPADDAGRAGEKYPVHVVSPARSRPALRRADIC